MIAKGTTHNNGARLAAYLVNSKDDERAELAELRGFAESDIVDAFRSVHVMAEATHCEKPFYHCQVRTPDGEELTPEQWREVADRLEKKLGLDDQPRAVAFHDKDGHRHMHVAWSRIDEETLTAKELKFDHRKLMEACREIEHDLGLTPVRSDRPEQELPAPSREEYEQARRLGVDIHDTRATIRDCWERSDNGQSFMTALDEQGLTLAKGDRRDFVVIDQEGGLHALGKRVLGVPAPEMRATLGDLDRGSLPSIAEARAGLEVQRGIADEAAPALVPEAEQPFIQEPAQPTELAMPEQEFGVAEVFQPGEAAEAGRSFADQVAPEIGRAAFGAADALASGVERTVSAGGDLAADLFTFGMASGSTTKRAPPQQERPMAHPPPKAPEPQERGDRSVTTNPAHVVMSSADALANVPKNPTEAPPDLAEAIMAKWRKDRERDQGRER